MIKFTFCLILFHLFKKCEYVYSASFTKDSVPFAKKRLELVQLQIVHRHGDRTPITPTRNETYWKQTLPSSEVLHKMSKFVNLIRDSNMQENSHSASGSIPFGQLTRLGLLQMVDLGTKIRSQIFQSRTEDSDERTDYTVVKTTLFSRENSVDLKRIKVISTNFHRTIQSVQGFLVGFFPDGIPGGNKIDIDVRYTNIMVPDPQPRRSELQVELEKMLCSRPYILQKEEELHDLAMKVSNILRRDILSNDSGSLSFGICEEEPSETDVQVKPLSWPQMAELTTCLRTRHILPSEITPEEQEIIVNHLAWRWFQTLRYPHLASIVMDEMVNLIVENAFQKRYNILHGIDGDDSSPCLHIFSAHDSTIIALICALHLKQPVNWPEYGSYLKVELLKDIDNLFYYIRFSFNGEILPCSLGNTNGETSELLPLDSLAELLFHSNKKIESLT